MASSGATAWTKYFQGKGDIPTRLKKDSPVFDMDGKKLSYTLPTGTEVVYLKTKVYEQKTPCQIQRGKKYETVRIPFDNLAKPGVKASGAASLKPQAFGVADKHKYKIPAYYTLIKNSIDGRKDLSADVRLYLDALLDSSANKAGASAKVKKIFSKASGSLPLNDIKKDFGEVLGPVAIYYKKLLVAKGMKTTAAMTVEVPLRPNEPLMDYAMFEGDIKYIISAKSGTTTNVVKPKDILDLLAKSPALVRKWSKTKEYQTLQVLADNSTIMGPIKAVGVLEPKLIDANSVGDEKKFNAKAVANFVKKNDYLSKKASPTLNEIMYECEKTLQEKSKSGALDLNSIFSDAIKGQVVYVKFDLDNNGDGDWDVIISSDIAKAKSGKRAYLRTKNGYTRASDRMGVQI